MSRDSNGDYTLPAGNPVLPDTEIESIWANTTMDDIAEALTDSLSRSGQGGMLAPLYFDDGSVGAPGIAWDAEHSSGLYRAGASDFRVSLSGNDKVRWTVASAMEFYISGVWTAIEDIGGTAATTVVALSTTQTFAADDAQTMQLLTGSTDRAWAIPLHSTVPWNTGDTIVCASQSTAKITLDPVVGVSLDSAIAQASNADRTVIPGGTAVLVYTGSDHWQLSGDII